MLKYLGAAYLLYLAWRMWTAPAHSAAAEAPRAEQPLRLFVAGLSLTLGNPKTMLFYLALLPNLIDLAAIGALGYAELVAVTLVVLAVVDGSYVLHGGARAPPVHQRAGAEGHEPRKRGAHGRRRGRRGGALAAALAEVWPPPARRLRGLPLHPSNHHL